MAQRCTSSRNGDPEKRWHAEPVVQIVVEIRAGGDDPIHKLRLSSGGTIADAPSPAGVSAPVRDMPTVPFFASIFPAEQAAAFREPGAIIGLECAVDEIGGGAVFFDRAGQEAGKFFVQ